MSKIAAALLLLFTAAPLQQRAPATPEIAGYWLGTLSIRARELRLLIHITAVDPPTATFTSIDQDNQPRAPKSIAIEGRTLTIVMPNGSRIAGQLRTDRRSIDATYEQSGATHRMTFERVAGPPVLVRPQYPVPPLPYDSEEVSIRSGEERLAGTFSKPRGAGPFPAVLLISGSGPQDRDETVFGHKPFLVLADYLTRRGIAVLRVDDRGAGASTGSRVAATVEDYAADALACVGFLAARNDVDRARIGLVGHSEGGIVAPMTAGLTRDVSFMVLLAAPAMDGASLAMLQAERIAQAAGASAQQLGLQQRLNRRIFDILMRESDESGVRAATRAVITEEFARLGVTSPEVVTMVEKQMEPQIRRGLSPWFRHFLAYDPLPSLRAARIPTLALYGGLDVQVPAAENAELMLAAIAKSSTVSDVQILPRLNHLFQTAKTGAMDEYGRIEETFAPIALDAIAAWLKRVTAK